MSGLPLILCRIIVDPEAYPKELVHKVGDILEGVPSHHRAQSHTHSLQQMSLDWGRKPEYLEETPKHRQNMQTPQTQGRGLT